MIFFRQSTGFSLSISARIFSLAALAEAVKSACEQLVNKQTSETFWKRRSFRTAQHPRAGAAGRELAEVARDEAVGGAK